MFQPVERQLFGGHTNHSHHLLHRMMLPYELDEGMKAGLVADSWVRHFNCVCFEGLNKWKERTLNHGNLPGQ